MPKERNCVFCGSSERPHPSTYLIAIGPTTERKNICGNCLSSIDDRTPQEWFRWLRRNDPALWESVVNYHRLENSDMADLVRRLRIEPV